VYNLEELVGKVVTIKFNNGIEIMGSLMAYNSDDRLLTIYHPRTVVAAEKEIALIPYLFTGNSTEVVIPLDSIQAIVESLAESAEGYKSVIEPSNKIIKASKKR